MLRRASRLYAPPGDCGESPLTLPPNFKCEKGSVTAAAAACMPLRGSFVGEKKPPLKGEARL